MLLSRLFDGSYYIENLVSFTNAQYENDFFSLVETCQKFILAFCHSKMYFHETRRLKLNKTMLKCFAFCKVYLRYRIVNKRDSELSQQSKQKLKIYQNVWSYTERNIQCCLSFRENTHSTSACLFDIMQLCLK